MIYLSTVECPRCGGQGAWVKEGHSFICAFDECEHEWRTEC